ncbi:hypothetical protein PGT21_015963 [Puccinia graminis f. sp. tritici]|uniref:Uncharacterized protein n=1 Tax=Puccinia graminis f. sp. tritici TaxID=56615 RepID=A0A5B0PG45_PUCGR|nr:hypothetical protein PGTUg99_019327 [Puccinia graminis f. sp. tritici]KAA1099640.1 hypothetical protein PGT21_015963 [Puccinia graminis f. sp. tritici]
MKMCFTGLLITLTLHLTFNLANGMISKWECPRQCCPEERNMEVYDANGTNCDLSHNCAGGRLHGPCKEFRAAVLGHCYSCNDHHMMFQEKDCPKALALKKHCDDHPSQAIASHSQGSYMGQASNQHSSYQY